MFPVQVIASFRKEMTELTCPEGMGNATTGGQPTAGRTGQDEEEGWESTYGSKHSEEQWPPAQQREGSFPD